MRTGWRGVDKVLENLRSLVAPAILLRGNAEIISSSDGGAVEGNGAHEGCFGVCGHDSIGFRR